MEGSAHSRLIFALDVASSQEAEVWASRLAQEIGLAKVGLELFAAAGPEVVRAVQRSAGVPVFLDLKLHDIPITVERSARALRELGVRMLTAHAQGGEAMLDAAVRGAGSDMQVLAVTRLTSQRASPAEVVELARVAQSAGCAGVVCSGHEIEAVRKALGSDMRIVCPGIRPRGADPAGQVRVVTPYDAIHLGADYIVVGRPIRDATDPVRVARGISAEIERASSI